MHTSDINKKGSTHRRLDIYYRIFTIAISPRGNDFKGIISKVPGGNSYCEGSIIDIKNRSDRDKLYAVSSRHVVFWPKILYSFCCGLHRVL